MRKALALVALLAAIAAAIYGIRTWRTARARASGRPTPGAYSPRG